MCVYLCVLPVFPYLFFYLKRAPRISLGRCLLCILVYVQEWDTLSRISLNCFLAEYCSALKSSDLRSPSMKLFSKAHCCYSCQFAGNCTLRPWWILLSLFSYTPSLQSLFQTHTQAHFLQLSFIKSLIPTCTLFPLLPLLLVPKVHSQSFLCCQPWNYNCFPLLKKHSSVTKFQIQQMR